MLTQSSSKRQSKLPVSPPQSTWDKVKAFFLYSETIFIARTEAVVGLLTVVFGSLDYSPFMGMTAFDKKQVIWLGSVSFIKGLFTELARRRNAVDLTTVPITPAP